jgi:hypothetical protein
VQTDTVASGKLNILVVETDIPRRSIDRGDGMKDERIFESAR